MRTSTSLLLSGLLLAAFAAPASAAPPADHPGCGGIGQALGQANAKGRTALLAVAERFECAEVDPDPVDPIACPDGQASLASWSYTGTLGEPIEHGYPTWTGEWTNLAGDGAAIAHGDAGGFYWTEVEPDSVQSIVLQSFGDADSDPEVVTLTEGLDPTAAISQNEFVVRTGINLVNFCG